MTVLIVKLGSTMPELAARRGDFDDWVREGLGCEAQVVDPRAGQRLPPPGAVEKIVLTGSHAMVTQRLPWSELTAAWLREVAAAGTPVLGICYGHQLLAHALGGQVGFNPRGPETGTARIERLPSAAADPLLRHLPESFLGQVHHSQSVLGLPPGAECLARNDHEPHHAFRWGQAVWGVQFHPEFDAEVSRAYVAADDRPATAAEPVGESPESQALLARFAQL